MRDAIRRGLAVGFFDGVHLGHQEILRHAAAALTFREHPLSVIAPERAPRLLMGAEERLAAIKACGVEKVIALDFTPELANMPAEESIDLYLGEARRDGVIYCGDNWRFGRGGLGDAKLLKANGINVEILPYAMYGGERISSTRIRNTLESGAVEEATAMLGRPWSVTGEVFKGKGAGAGLGYPTVNLRLRGMMLNLRRGVYSVESCGMRGIANYGVAPTFGDKAWTEPVFEVHFLDAPPEIGPEGTLRVNVLSFIRPEMRLASAEDLRRQIADDLGRR